MKVMGRLSTASSDQHSFAGSMRGLAQLSLGHHKSIGSSVSTAGRSTTTANGSRNARATQSRDGTVGRLSAEIIRGQASDPDSLGGVGIGSIDSDRSTPEGHDENTEMHNSLLNTRELERAIMGGEKKSSSPLMTMMRRRSGEYRRR